MPRAVSLLVRTTLVLAVSAIAIAVTAILALNVFVISPIAERSADDEAALLVLSAQTWVELPPDSRPYFELELAQNHDLIISSRAARPAGGGPESAVSRPVADEADGTARHRRPPDAGRRSRLGERADGELHDADRLLAEPQRHPTAERRLDHRHHRRRDRIRHVTVDRAAHCAAIGARGATGRDVSRRRGVCAIAGERPDRTRDAGAQFQHDGARDRDTVVESHDAAGRNFARSAHAVGAGCVSRSNCSRPTSTRS